MFLLLLSLPVLPRHAKMEGSVYQVTKMASLNASARKASLEISARKVRCYLQLPDWISIYLHKIWPSIQGLPCPKSSLLLVYYRQRSQLSDIASVLQLTSFPIEIYQRLPLTNSFDAALCIPCKEWISTITSVNNC